MENNDKSKVGISVVPCSSGDKSSNKWQCSPFSQVSMHKNRQFQQKEGITLRQGE